MKNRVRHYNGVHERIIVIMSFLIAMVIMSIPSQSYASEKMVDADGTSLTVNNLMSGDTVSAFRVINVSYEHGSETRAFADGFSYGSAQDQSDNQKGLVAYNELTDEAAIQSAVQSFIDQKNDSTPSYAATANGDAAIFDELPFGQYVIQVTSVDGSRQYSNMLANVVADAYQVSPITVSAKYIDTMNPPDIEIEKDSNIHTVDYAGQPIEYTLTATQPVQFGVAHNVHIVDSLDQDAIDVGMKLNKDVQVYGTDGSLINNVLITYKESNGNVVGFQIDLPDPMNYNDVITVKYTGDTSSIKSPTEIHNTTQIWSDESSDDDDNIVDYKFGDSLQQTGDSLRTLSYAGMIAGVIIIMSIVAYKRRSRR